MEETHPISPLRDKWFYLRLLASYLLLPLIPPLVLLIPSNGFSLGFGNWAGIVFIYGIFGLAAMLLLGTPLLVWFLHLRWTGFLPFAIGGAACAGTTTFVVLRNSRDSFFMVLIFTGAGLLAGALFRLILFGTGKQITYGATGRVHKH